MPLELNPSAQAVQSLPEPAPYDAVADRDSVVAGLADSQVIDDLTSTIDISDMTTILTFGARAAEDIAAASDKVLRTMTAPRMEESDKLMETLAGIMRRFDIDEVRDNPSLLGRLFGGARRQLDRVLEKYTNLGGEVDRIYVRLRAYEGELKQSSRMLEDMFRANVNSFHELEKYIVAGEQGCKEIREYLAQRQAEYDRTGDADISFELQTLRQALTLLEQRTQDLRTAEVVAMQSIPMIRAMQLNNLNLARRINSAFIVTLPVFKQALAQAILLKRQRVQAEAMSALDRRTGEMLQRNARDAAAQAKIAARTAPGGVSADALERAWRTIVDGIGDAQKLRQSAEAQRREDRQRLEAIRRDYLNRTHPGREAETDLRQEG